MEEILRQLLEGQKQILNRLDKLEGKVDNIEGDVTAIKGQQSENSNYIQALLHRSEELDAKFDGLLHNTPSKDALALLASKDDIANLDSKFEVLNARLFHQEAELYKIKAVR